MFGEVALVFRGKRRRDVVALTWTRLLFLSLSDWDELVVAFPAMLASLRSKVDENHYDVSENGHGDPNGKKTPESAPRDKTDPTSEPTTPAEAARQTLG